MRSITAPFRAEVGTSVLKEQIKRMVNTDALVAVLQKIRESARKDRNDDICREKYDALTATFHEYEWSAMREGNIYICSVVLSVDGC